MRSIPLSHRAALVMALGSVMLTTYGVYEVETQPPSHPMQVLLHPYDRDPMTGQLMGWPDNRGVDEATFREDCTDVCAAPPILRPREGERHVRQRVLYADPEHLVCVCLRPTGTVLRYVGWQLR